jgi:hypothetical protein
MHPSSNPMMTNLCFSSGALGIYGPMQDVSLAEQHIFLGPIVTFIGVPIVQLDRRKSAS